MESPRLWMRVAICVVLLFFECSAETGDFDKRALTDLYPKDPNLTNEKELCDVGEQCAVRKGARIGKLCDCPRGAICNFFLLKCL
ncbi:CART protein, partial [Polypterus senegalus]|nr:CART protein [Polypterus senegalus]